MITVPSSFTLDSPSFSLNTQRGPPSIVSLRIFSSFIIGLILRSPFLCESNFVTNSWAIFTRPIDLVVLGERKINSIFQRGAVILLCYTSMKSLWKPLYRLYNGDSQNDQNNEENQRFRVFQIHFDQVIPQPFQNFTYGRHFCNFSEAASSKRQKSRESWTFRSRGSGSKISWNFRGTRVFRGTDYEKRLRNTMRDVWEILSFPTDIFGVRTYELLSTDR